MRTESITSARITNNSHAEALSAIRAAERIAATIMDVRVLGLLVFFSSRRRHTRLQGDWSSVCSSDLISLLAPCSTTFLSTRPSNVELSCESQTPIRGLKRLFEQGVWIKNPLWSKVCGVEYRGANKSDVSTVRSDTSSLYQMVG